MKRHVYQEQDPGGTNDKGRTRVKISLTEIKREKKKDTVKPSRSMSKLVGQLVIANALLPQKSSTVTSPLAQNLMAESVTFVIATSPAFVAGFYSGTENGGGDYGDDNKESVLGHGTGCDNHC